MSTQDTDKTHLHTRSQQDAAKVYEKVAEQKKKKEADQKEKKEQDRYSSMCQTLPVLIRTAGLMQALTFLHAKAGDAGVEQLGNDLGETLGYTDLEKLADTARKAELAQYMLLTQRALEQLLWYKRYAQVLLDGE
ncbi:MAG: type III-B CRISPR module-associated protein Cmr5 [Chloroflexaceae bacterium]|nr:type III-B CRISPR module-associated protein Cmr5 [Chloroflexaceae bacterium]